MAETWPFLPVMPEWISDVYVQNLFPLLFATRSCFPTGDDSSSTLFDVDKTITEDVPGLCPMVDNGGLCSGSSKTNGIPAGGNFHLLVEITDFKLLI